MGGERTSSAADGSEPPRDPVTGQVMTKRAIRRRIVKAWERKQKEQKIAEGMDADALRVGHGRHQDEVHSGAASTFAGEEGLATVRAPSPTSSSSLAIINHPLRTAAAVPVLSSRYFETERDGGGFRIGSCLPTIDQRPPFEFLFRMPNSAPDGPEGRGKSARGRDAEDAPGSGANSDSTAGRHGSDCAVVDEAFIAALAQPILSHPHPAHDVDDDIHDGGRDDTLPEGRSRHQAPTSQLPIPNSYAPFSSGDDGGDDGVTSPTSPAGFLAFRPVIRRVERQPALPLAPFSPGTDLNLPTENYLSLDSMWGLHRHAPGFYRDAETATHSLMSAAARIFSNEGRAVNVISTGDAMTRLFESSFRSDQPFTVHVHRVGPAIVLHAPEHGVPQQTIEQVRKKALLSKALYRMSSVGGGHRQLGDRPATAGPQAPVDERVVALRGPTALDDMADMPRAGTLSFSAAVQHNEILHNFGNVLHWGIQNLEVLIGLDTPVLLDRDHDNAEVAFAMHDTLSGMEISDPSHVQYDALRCWFESTLANVAHVGFCVHNRGVVQSFELKKVTDLLTFAEAQVATAAMGFTTNALRWLTEHCTEDGTDYAVIRNPETNTLELYALHHASPSSTDPQHVEGRWTEDEEDLASDERHRIRTGSNAGATASSSEAGGGASGGRSPPPIVLDVTLAVLCHRMGVHLLGKGKPSEALKLLLRSFQIHHLHCHEESSAAPMLDICSRLPAIVKEYIASELPRGAALAASSEGNERHEPQPPQATIPSKFQEVMFACMRIEDRVRQMLEYYTFPGRGQPPSVNIGGSGRVALSAPSLAKMLLWCAAALGLIVDACVGWWSDVLARLTTLKHAVVHRQRDSAVQLHIVVFKELVQVALEGVVVLEGICLALRPGTDDATAAFPEGAGGGCDTLCGGMVATTSVGNNNKLPPDCCTALARTNTSIVDQEVHLHQILPTRELMHLTTAICELLGDMCLCALSDCSPTTVTTLIEVSQLMLSTSPSPSTLRPPSSLSVFTSLRQQAGGGGLETTLFQEATQWYSKVQKLHCGRHQNIQRKIATAYFHFATHFHKTDRWTKAVENLKRALDVLNAAPALGSTAAAAMAADEGALLVRGVQCVTELKVRLELSIVWAKMSRRRDNLPVTLSAIESGKSESSPYWSLFQRLCPSSFQRPFPDDEEKQLQNCLGELRHCSALLLQTVAATTTATTTTTTTTAHNVNSEDDRQSQSAYEHEHASLSACLASFQVLLSVRMCDGVVHELRQGFATTGSSWYQQRMGMAEELLKSSFDFLASSSVPGKVSRWVSCGWLVWLSTTACHLSAFHAQGSAADGAPLSRAPLQFAIDQCCSTYAQTQDELRGASSTVVVGSSALPQCSNPSAVPHASADRVLEVLMPAIALHAAARQDMFVALLCTLVHASNDACKHHRPLSPLLEWLQKEIASAVLKQARLSRSAGVLLASECQEERQEEEAPVEVLLCRTALRCLHATAMASSLSVPHCDIRTVAEVLRMGCVAFTRVGASPGELQRWKGTLGALLRMEMEANGGERNQVAGLLRECLFS